MDATVESANRTTEIWEFEAKAPSTQQGMTDHVVGTKDGGMPRSTASTC